VAQGVCHNFFSITYVVVNNLMFSLARIFRPVLYLGGVPLGLTMTMFIFKQKLGSKYRLEHFGHRSIARQTSPHLLILE